MLKVYNLSEKGERVFCLKLWFKFLVLLFFSVGLMIIRFFMGFIYIGYKVEFIVVLNKDIR